MYGKGRQPGSDGARHSRLFHSTAAALPFQEPENLINSPFAHRIAFGKQGDGVGCLLSACFHPEIIAIEVGQAVVVRPLDSHRAKAVEHIATER